jgi:RsiW-degrading membrane proteinase PrsW (M82 family)
MNKLHVPGGPQRQRWAGPSVLAVLPMLAPGARREITPLLWVGGFFLLTALALLWVDSPLLVELIVALQVSVILLLSISVVSGRRKPIWSFVATFVLTALSLLLVFPVLVHLTVWPDPLGQSSLGTPLLKLFFGVGIREELVKSVPVFVMLALARWPRVPRSLTVRDSIDGVLIGAAAGVSFTLIETLGQYVPHTMALVESHGGDVAAQGYVGLTLTLARVISSAGGHVAWSGFFGYSIGLARTYPPYRRPLTLLTGLVVAALLHALWDDFNSEAVYVLIALVSYALLISVVVGGRQRAAAATAPLVAAPAPVPSSGLGLHVGANRYALTAGMVLTGAELPGLKPSGSGPVVASVQPNPSTPQILGLRNESGQTWSVRPAGQAEVQLPTGRTVRLTAGLSIRFGATIGLVG